MILSNDWMQIFLSVTSGVIAGFSTMFSANNFFDGLGVMVLVTTIVAIILDYKYTRGIDKTSKGLARQ